MLPLSMLQNAEVKVNEGSIKNNQYCHHRVDACVDTAANAVVVISLLTKAILPSVQLMPLHVRSFACEVLSRPTARAQAMPAMSDQRCSAHSC